jgi:hypothetical protein
MLQSKMKIRQKRGSMSRTSLKAELTVMIAVIVKIVQRAKIARIVRIARTVKTVTIRVWKNRAVER